MPSRFFAGKPPWTFRPPPGLLTKAQLARRRAHLRAYMAGRVSGAEHERAANHIMNVYKAHHGFEMQEHDSKTDELAKTVRLASLWIVRTLTGLMLLPSFIALPLGSSRMRKTYLPELRSLPCPTIGMTFYNVR